jgi:hypothetical protein
MAAGTTTSRMTVASNAIPIASPKPSCWMGRMAVNANAPKTANISVAAPEISGAVRVSPFATLLVLSAVRAYSSPTRWSRNTS